MVEVQPEHEPAYRDGTDAKPINSGDALSSWVIDGDNNTITNLPTSSLGNTIREANSLDLAQAIFDRCTDPRLIMVADQEPGAELITNGQDWTGATGATPPTGWTSYNAGVHSIIADNGPSGTGDDNLKLEVNATPDSAPGVYSEFNTVIGESYTLSLWFKHGTGTKGQVKVGTFLGDSSIRLFDNLTDASWKNYGCTFIATTTTTHIFLQTISSTAGQYEEFDNITCTLTCKDYSSKGHNGMFHGAMTSGDRVDQGSVFMYDLDGSNDYIDFGDDDDFSYDDSGAAPVTIGALVEVILNITYDVIISKWDEGNALREYLLQVDTVEQAIMWLSDESADTHPFVSSSVMSAGIHFIVVTYDGSGGNDADDGLNMYIDGVLDNDAKSGTVNYTAMEPNTTSLVVGARLSNGVCDREYPGDLGEVFLDASEWSAADVWSLWLQVKGKYGL